MKTRKILSLALAMTMSLQLTACTEEEVASTVGAIAIIAGAAVIAANSECVGGYRDACHTTVDYWGYTQTECERVYDSCLYTRIKGFAGLGPVEAPADEVVTDVKWGETFALSFKSSGRLIDALKMARDQKDLKGLKDLGLGNRDLKRLAKFELPTEKGLDAMARELNQDKKATEAMLTQLLTEAQVQSAGRMLTK